jgi:hypothetical protein
MARHHHDYADRAQLGARPRRGKGLVAHLTVLAGAAVSAERRGVSDIGDGGLPPISSTVLKGDFSYACKDETDH